MIKIRPQCANTKCFKRYVASQGTPTQEIGNQINNRKNLCAQISKSLKLFELAILYLVRFHRHTNECISYISFWTVMPFMSPITKVSFFRQATLVAHQLKKKSRKTIPEHILMFLNSKFEQVVTCHTTHSSWPEENSWNCHVLMQFHQNQWNPKVKNKSIWIPLYHWNFNWTQKTSLKWHE